MSTSQTTPRRDIFLTPNIYLDQSDGLAHYSTPNVSPATGSESETSVPSELFSVNLGNESDLSPSENPTQINRIIVVTPEKPGLSDSVTPVNNLVSEMAAFDPDQLTLRLYLCSTLKGRKKLPKWDGLAKALRVYFRESWQRDNYSQEYCEGHVEFLYSVAIAEEKWRLRRRVVG